MLQIEITTSSAMASYRWISAIQQQSICDVLSDAMTAQRLDVDYSHCSKEQFFANIPYCKVKNRLSSVAVIAMWTDRKNKNIEIEVRSDESILRGQTQCEDVTAAMLKSLPAL